MAFNDVLTVTEATHIQVISVIMRVIYVKLKSYLVVVLFDIEHANIKHFSGEHVGQGSSSLGHCNVEEAAKQTALSNISKYSLTHKLVLISFGQTLERLVVLSSVLTVHCQKRF